MQNICKHGTVLVNTDPNFVQGQLTTLTAFLNLVSSPTISFLRND